MWHFLRLSIIRILPKAAISWNLKLYKRIFFFTHIKETRESNSRSCTTKKLMSQWRLPLEHCMWSATKVYLKFSIRFSSIKASFRTWPPHQKSCQNLSLVPLPTSNIVNLEKVPHSLIYFHKLTPYGPLTTLEHHPPHMLSCFMYTILPTLENNVTEF